MNKYFISGPGFEATVSLDSSLISGFVVSDLQIINGIIDAHASQANAFGFEYTVTSLTSDE